MGSNLRRELREALPPSIKGLQRAVALEIADDARYDDGWNYDPERGRRSRVRLTDLVRWTAAKDELSVREMLRRLSLAGWEFRLPIGKDKNGNLMYAVPGKAMTFRVPDFEGPTTVGPYVETETEGPTTVGGRANHGWAMAQPPLGVPPTTVGPGPTTVGPPSPVSSFSTKESPPSSSVAEDSGEGSVGLTDATDGGGGGSLSLEEITNQSDRVDAFVATLDFRGKAPGKQQRLKIGQRVMAAFKAGWSEHGLARYLDFSDDPSVRSAAALYLHRLDAEQLPDAGEAEAITNALPPPCAVCKFKEGAHTDPSQRTHPFGGPCPDCHPDANKPTKLPPVCQMCRDQNPSAEFNVRFRTDYLSFDGGPCPRCHPALVPGDWSWPGMDTADGGMWERAAARARERGAEARAQVVGGARAAAHTADEYTSASVDDLFAPRAAPLPGTDAKVAGWMAISRQLAAKDAAKTGPQPQIARGHKPYRDPEDQSVYDAPLLADEPPVDQSRYDEDL